MAGKKHLKPLLFLTVACLSVICGFAHGLNAACARSLSAEYREKIAGEYTTKLTADRNRNNNIRLACAAINGRIVQPGEVFSFNKTVGKRTKERGYKPAIIFVNGRKTEGIGGGICQVSSTLYNAVLEAGLTVVERHPHSLPVGYVPKGRDATVFYGWLDFKFKNNTSMPVRIYASVKGNELTVAITEIIRD